MPHSSRADDGLAGAEDDEAGQVLVLGAEAVGEPRPEAGPDRLHVRRSSSSSRRGSWFGVSVCIERMTQRSSMHSADLGEQLADLDARSGRTCGT